jgi:hypothetical protein
MANILCRVIILVLLGTVRAGADAGIPPDPKTDLREQAIVYPSAGDFLRLTIDFAQVVMIDRPIGTIVIGNPGIADASLTDPQTMVLVGKSAGSTNVIVMGRQGERITTFAVDVVADGRHLLTVRQGLSRETYSCIHRCEPVLSVGDDAVRFSTTQSQLEDRHEFADVDE